MRSVILTESIRTRGQEQNGIALELLGMMGSVTLRDRFYAFSMRTTYGCQKSSLTR
jgi:hypothetical protein